MNQTLHSGPVPLVLALSWAALSCSSSATPPTSPPATPVAAPAAGLAMQPASFAAFESASVRTAAMQYPAIATEEPAPPLSLTASDGTGLALEALEARAVIDGPLAFTELRMQFRNPQDRVIEGRFAITLPEGAAISRLAMKIDGGWQEAEVVERQAARRAYEDFLHRRQDPALLEKEAGNEFRARIFPIPARGVKDIILSYSQELTGDGTDRDGGDTYVLPLRGLPEIASLAVTALVGRAQGGYETIRFARTRHAPKADFSIPSASRGRAGLRSGNLVMARVRPKLKASAAAMSGAVILMDTSASRAPGFASAVERLGALIRALAARHGDLAITVAAFDQDVLPVYSGRAADFGAAHLDALRARRPLGASNLDAALAWAATVADRDRLLVVSDAIPTAGDIGADALQSRLRAMGAHYRRLDMILDGGIRDRELARALVAGTLPTDGAVLDARAPAQTLARRVSETTASDIAVTVAGASWVWPERLDGIQPGDDVLVYAGLERGALAPGQPLAVTLGGAAAGTHTIPLGEAPQPLLARAAAHAQIARLTARRGAIPADTGAGERAELARAIVDLSVAHRVLSDFTALLVLETEDDYRRFGIDRRALVDIMTVGDSGVTMLQRAAPVLLIADGRDDSVRNADTRKSSGTARGAKDKEKAGAWKNDEDARDMSKREAMKTLEEAPADMPAAELDMDAAGSLQGADVDGVEGGVEGGVVGGVLGGVSGSVAAGPTVGAAAPPPAPPPPPPAQVRPARPDPRTQAPPAREHSQADRVDRRPAPAARPRPTPRPSRDSDGDAIDARAFSAQIASPEPEPGPAEMKQDGPPPYTGPLAELMNRLERGDVDGALVQALRWQTTEPGDMMALIGLGEALEAANQPALAARAYGSIIDLFPSRADMRRFAGERLERISGAAPLAADSYAKAVEQRPDHLTGHRLLAYARLRAGDHDGALAALEAGLGRSYPSGRFTGGPRILREDAGIVAAAWIAKKPAVRDAALARLRTIGASLATAPSLRFVLNWETDANDVDFHIYDGRGGHAYYSDRDLPSGGTLYEDITNGYGPECFTIDGTPDAYPYRLQIHYYSRGPMGFGMGKLQIVAHDGAGGVSLAERPFVVMNDSAYVDLGVVKAPGATAVLAR